jgi:hypothetical protein
VLNGLKVTTVVNPKIRVSRVCIMPNKEGHSLYPLGMPQGLKTSLVGILNRWIAIVPVECITLAADTALYLSKL